MFRTGRFCRWLVMLAGATALWQVPACNLSPEVQQQFRDQILLPQLGSIVSDALFFLLDNAFVRLST